MSLRLQEAGGIVQFAVKTVPGASRDRIVGLLGDALKVAVTAPPERGKANQRLCALIAAALGVATSAVQVVAGATSPRKTIAVRGLTITAVRARLDA